MMTVIMSMLVFYVVPACRYQRFARTHVLKIEMKIIKFFCNAGTCLQDHTTLQRRTIISTALSEIDTLTPISILFWTCNRETHQDKIVSARHKPKHNHPGTIRKVRFQVLTAASMKRTIFWHVASRSLVETDLIMETVNTSETSTHFYQSPRRKPPPPPRLPSSYQKQFRKQHVNFRDRKYRYINFTYYVTIRSRMHTYILLRNHQSSNTKTNRFLWVTTRKLRGETTVLSSPWAYMPPPSVMINEQLS
jgi:hypothetical protein